jgi:hypothetical protein
MARRHLGRPRLGGSRAFTAIRNRFVAINLPLILIATLGLYGVSEWMVSSFTNLSIREELHRVSTQISQAVSRHVVNDNKLQIRNVLAGAAANPDLRAVQILDPKGRVIGSVGKTPKAIPAGMKHSVPIITKIGDQTKNVGAVKVVLSTNRLVNATDDRRQIVAIIALCLAMIAVVIGMMVQEWTIRSPLKKLIDAIRRREQTTNFKSARRCICPRLRRPMERLSERSMSERRTWRWPGIRRVRRWRLGMPLWPS